MQGIITTIQRMSIHDGPGLRSTIFLKRCNLRCKWCHNPETFSLSAELEFLSHKCINCGSCVDQCKPKALSYDAGIVQFNKQKCTACFDCIPECYPEAIHKIGRNVSVDQLFDEVKIDFPFFKESNGGITISGGEPMLQNNFILALLKRFNEANIHTAIETNLSIAWEKYEEILPYVDLIMADIKIAEPELHKRWTGVGNAKILSNIKKLDQSGKTYWLRTPIIPGVNHTNESISSIVDFVSELKNIKKFELLPFHPLGETKYKSLGIKNPFKNSKTLSEKDLEGYNKLLNKISIA